MTTTTDPAVLAAVAPAEQPSNLPERTWPLALATGLAERARHGNGSVLLLTGPAGVGRSALLAAVVRHQETHGMHALWARCSADEAEDEYAAARQLFSIGAGYPYPAQPGPPSAGPSADAEAGLWEPLHLHATHHPLLIAVDDIHLADTPSRRWLLQLARRIDRLPILLITTERRQRELRTQAPRFGRTLPASLARHCRIGPLGPPAVGEVVRRHLGTAAPQALADDCARATGGNPMLLDALLTDLRETTRTVGCLTLPADCAGLPAGAYLDAVDLWLHSAGDGHATAVRTLATLQGHQLGHHLGHPDRTPPTATALAELTDEDPARLADLTAELHRQGLLLPGRTGDWPRFAHPLLREAVLDGWGPARRAQAHRAAATALHRRGEPDELIAEHLLHAPGPDGPWAADVLLRAAHAAQRAEQDRAAVGYLRRALDEELPALTHSTALTELGCLEISLGPADHAAGIRHLTEAVYLHQSDERVFEAANALSAALAGQGRTPAALDILEQLAERFAERPELAGAVQAAAALIASHDGDSWLQVVEGLRRIAARAPRRLAPAAWALLTEYDSTIGHLSAAEVITRVRELTSLPLDPFSGAYVLASAATLAQWAEQFPETDRIVTQGLAEHQGPLLHPARQSLLSVRAESRVMRGQYRQLLDELGFTTDQLPALDNTHLLAQGVLALVETGRLTQAHQLARHATGASDSWEWNEYLYARGLLHLASGDPAAALADLIECGARQSERHVESPIVTPWRSAAADCHLALGNPGPAAALAATELDLARAWGTPRTIGRAMRTLGAATGGRRGLAMAAEAVDLLRAAEVDTELVPALLTHGRMLGESGRRAAARQSLREAAERAERIGAHRLLALAGDLLLESGARPTKTHHTGVAALTDSERRICRFAIEGHSNAQIATLLHLAVRTVETHLTNSFRKLGIRGRGELGAALGRGGHGR
ncbi:LuxR family transcriptional regulator [Kitasatospora sp. MAP5-34]|uniref:AAA family ATPase n=1 Tax=Kitasatospora sp. MAP5-34 TaxID=3035102 RepID=UPI002474A682|nr:LuxR family transcriptional regulator [Kitasatospora sp. MAP5-34]MDH6578655.1 DNA-binding CsgD family transcriptional regulator [Kitasatospora sp. MAP5-34]